MPINQQIINSLPLLLTGKKGYSLFSPSDWNNFIQLLQFHGLAPYFLANKHFAQSTIPGEIHDILKESVQKSTVSGMQKLQVLEELSQLCTSHFIPILLIKGMALSSILYNDPFQRPSVDIDIVLTPEEESQLKNTFLEKGAKEYGNVQNKFIRGLMPHSNPVIFKGVTIEIHNTIFPATHKSVINDFNIPKHFLSVDLNNNKYLTLNPHLYLYYLCFHAHHHLVTGRIKLLWLVDIVLLTNKYFKGHIDSEILENAKRNNLTDQVQSVFFLIQKHINPSLKLHADFEKNERIKKLEKTFLNLVQQNKSNKANYFSGTMHSLPFRHKVKYLLSILFPSKKYISEKYGIRNAVLIFFLIIINPFRICFKVLQVMIKRF